MINPTSEQITLLKSLASKLTRRDQAPGIYNRFYKACLHTCLNAYTNQGYLNLGIQDKRKVNQCLDDLVQDAYNCNYITNKQANDLLANLTLPL